VVAVAASLMLLTLQRASATARYAVCWAAALLILALPALPLVPSAQPAADAFLPTPTDVVVSLPDAWWTSTRVILAAWLVWGSIQLIRLVSAVVAIRRARAGSCAFPAHLQAVLPHWRRLRREGRRATLVLSDSITSAAVFGWGSPMIAVAPSLVRTLAPDDLDRVLIHEWAHVQRHDDAANVLQIVIRIVAGWHPALWWIDRRLHVEREIACDEMAVAITGSPKSYAQCLMKLSTAASTSMTMLTAPAVFASGLRARVVKIVSPQPLLAPAWSRGLAAAIVLVLCGISVVVGVRTLVGATAFVQPLVSPRIQTLSPPSRPAVSVAQTATDTHTGPSPRRAPGPASSPQRPKAEPPPPSPQPVLELAAAPVSHESSAVDSTHAADVAPEPPATVVSEVASVPQPPSPTPDVTAEAPRSPWTAAADGAVALARTSKDAGVTVGRTSKDAGVATAGVFTRFARRVAGSF